VSRTGYTEKEIVDPNTINFKVTGAVHYKLKPNLEAVFAGYWGTGNTVYTGSDRYSLKDLKIGQYKLELNGGHWFVRAYTTQENAGQSFNATATTRLVPTKPGSQAAAPPAGMHNMDRRSWQLNWRV
jgi:hypothetical protein